MGGIFFPPTFAPLPAPLPIPWSAASVGSVLTKVSSIELAFESGGGGGLPARYTATLSGATSELAPSGFPASGEMGARIIVTCTATSLVQTIAAGNDGEMLFLWNQTSVTDGYLLELENEGSGSGAIILMPASSAIIPPQSGVFLIYDATLASWLLDS